MFDKNSNETEPNETNKSMVSWSWVLSTLFYTDFFSSLLSSSSILIFCDAGEGEDVEMRHSTGTGIAHLYEYIAIRLSLFLVFLLMCMEHERWVD